MPGIISGVVPEGLYVRGTQIPAEGFVPIASLPEDRYRYERRGHVIEGFRSSNRFRMGDQLTVRIESIDLPRRSLTLAVVANHTAKSQAGTHTSKTGSKGGYPPKSRKIHPKSKKGKRGRR